MTNINGSNNNVQGPNSKSQKAKNKTAKQEAQTHFATNKTNKEEVKATRLASQTAAVAAKSRVAGQIKTDSQPYVMIAGIKVKLDANQLNASTRNGLGVFAEAHDLVHLTRYAGTL